MSHQSGTHKFLLRLYTNQRKQPHSFRYSKPVPSNTKDLARNLLFFFLSSSTSLIEDPVSFLFLSFARELPWIPAFAGMTVRGCPSYFHTNDSKGNRGSRVFAFPPPPFPTRGRGGIGKEKEWYVIAPLSGCRLPTPLPDRCEWLAFVRPWWPRNEGPTRVACWRHE